jgi:hypothetical protein
MKTLFMVLALMAASFSAMAGEKVQFGFWDSSRISYDRGSRSGFVEQEMGDANFHFQVKSRKVSEFLACATGSGTDNTVYLLGEEMADGSNLVTQSYICVGEINLGNCSKKKTTCR